MVRSPIRTIGLVIGLGTVLACSPTPPRAESGGGQPVLVGGQEVATFAGGCFWTMEAKFEAVPGVVRVVSGMTGGQSGNLTAEAFARGGTGYVEAVQVVFDPTKVSYRTLVDKFWRMIDPTDAEGQFCDRGGNYGTAVFATPSQTAEAKTSRREAMAALARQTFLTPVRPASRFWPAPADQQDFARNNSSRYAGYERFCGREERLVELWGNAGGRPA